MNLNEQKKKLRSHFSELRSSLRSEEKDNCITQRIIRHKKIADADTVLLYASFRSEVDTWKMAEYLLKTGAVIAYPKCGEGRGMTFYRITALDQLKSGKFGIKEPESSLPCPEITDKTVCIVPGLAFTENGGRLGYGGGFYDTFMKLYPEVYTIALAYEELIVPSLPLAKHDTRVNEIITEERMALCNE